MTRTQSTIVWGVALLAAALVLGFGGSLAWVLGAAGAVPVLAGLVLAARSDDDASRVKAAAARAARVSGDR